MRTTELRTCPGCEKSFEIEVYNRKVYCTLDCSYKHRMDSRKKGIYVKCKVCDNIMYQLINGSKGCCSVKCAGLYRTSLVVRTEVMCANDDCNSIFTKTQTTINRQKKKFSKFYCCVRCLNIGRSKQAWELHKTTNTKPELKFKSILELNNIEFEQQYSLQWIKGWKKWFDFYIPKLNLLIEIDGVYWHGKGKRFSELNDTQKHTRKNDKLKNELATSSGYNLIRIWEDEIDLFNIKRL